MEATKRFILDRIDELHGTGKYESFGKILADRSIRYRLWPGDIEAELTRRAEKQARGGHAVFEDGQWVKRSVPKPSVLMWKIRAQHTLARAYAHVGRIERALDYYRELFEGYEFLTEHPLYEERQRDPIRTEAHFMLLRHHAKTGLLIRDHAVNKINRLNVVRDGLVFRRDFKDRGLDARARVASRYEERGHEYFDFAASSGYQIDSVTLRAKIEGIGSFGFSLPQPAGWPPQFSFSKRFENFKFWRPGDYERTVALPSGTEFFSIGTGWGRGLYSNTPVEALYHKLFGPKDGPDIVRWEASFAVSPKHGVTVEPGFPFWPSWSVYDSRLPAAMQRFSHCCQVRYSFRCRCGLRMLADHGVPAKPEGPLATPLPRRPSATRVRWLFRAVDVTLRAQVAPKSAAACRRTTSGSDAPPQAATNNIARASRAVRPSSSADAASSSATSF